MASASDSQPARHRLRIELWSWSAWLILAIISYPAVLLIWIAPRAGLLAGLLVGLLVAYAASLGYSGRRELDRWLLPSLLSLAAACLVAATALFADRANAATAALGGLILGAETAFVWHFLPWLVRDADSPEVPSSVRLGLLGRRAEGRAPARPALGLVLLLALLSLGLGAVWSRGEVKVPNPTAWIVLVGLFTLAFMFVERLAFFERSAREGNLLLAAGSYRKWLAAALVSLALVGALAAVVPVKHAREREADARAGTALADTRDIWSPEQALTQPLDPFRGTLGRVSAALGALPRGIFPLLLLLLLLLLALVLIWGFRRSRAAQWLLRSVAWLMSMAARAWNRFRSWLGRLRGGLADRQATEPEAAPPADPLFDPFEHPEALAGLTAREIVIYTYHLLLNLADMLGHGRRRGQTPFEYANALTPSVPDASESLLALTWAYSGAMYGAEKAAVPDPASVRDFWQRVSSSLASHFTEDELALRRRAYLAARTVDRRR